MHNIRFSLSALAGAAVLCLAVSYWHSKYQFEKFELFTKKDLNIVNWAYDVDSSPQMLASKNDDGHTKMWNAAAGNEKVSSERQAIKPVRETFNGVPKFYAHATGWVNDLVQPDAKSSRSLQLSARPSVQTTKLLQQGLWNAAKNDEITVKNVGHLHASEMTEIQKLSPEYDSLFPKLASGSEMNYHPLKWMKEQRDPSAVRPHSKQLMSTSHFSSPTSMLLMTSWAGKSAPKAQFQELWNAAADDIIGGDPNVDRPGHLKYEPRKWLRRQRDEAEMAEMHPHIGKRSFARAEDHEEDAQGEYVSDNAIGLNVDAI